MQAAVDFNGSGSSGKSIAAGSSVGSSTATVTVLAESRDEKLSLDAAPATSTLLLGATSATTCADPGGAHVLRQRLQGGKTLAGGNAGATGTTTAGAASAPHARNGVVNAHKNGNAVRIEATATATATASSYPGSSVEPMRGTPRPPSLSASPAPSPQPSPAKRAMEGGAARSAANNNNITLNTSSSSGSDDGSGSALSSGRNSLSSSSSSSVIATPVAPTRHSDTNNGRCSGSSSSSGGGAGFGRTELTAGRALPVSSATMTPTIAATTPPAASSPTSLSATSPATNAITGAAEPELLQWKDMPQYLQFNPYVLQGYRPLQTFRGCLFSLFYWHNETINILTHAIPIVYILAIVPGLMPWEKGYRFLSFCHVFGSVAPWCGSFVYHLFMNIEKGENVYYRLLKLDMVGIWVSQSFGALPLVTATTFCFTFKWKWFIIISYSLLSLWGLYKAMTASSPWQRRLCFALPFTMRSILTFLRTMGLVGGNRVAMSHVYLQDGVSILGGAIGAMRIPEKWFPGLVDFYLNSHNIMHVLVVVAVYSMHQATIKDIEWMSATTCESLANATGAAIESTISANIEL